jgi:hypothetical protein
VDTCARSTRRRAGLGHVLDVDERESGCQLSANAFETAAFDHDVENVSLRIVGPRLDGIDRQHVSVGAQDRVDRSRSHLGRQSGDAQHSDGR